MVFIMNREGTIVETVTSPVHQGSNANEILLLAPFAPTNTVTVGFKLPNGILIQPRLSESGTGETMTALEVNDLFLKIGADEESMSAWYIKINRDLTRYSGELGIQFFIYDDAGDILASSYATVTVQKGVAILDGTTFDTSTATQLQAELEKVLSALSAVNYNIGMLQAEFSTLQTDVGTLQTDVGTLQTDFGTLQTDVSTLQTDMSGAKEEITILKDRMEQAETDITVTAGDITRLTDSVDKNTTDIADLKYRMEQAETDISGAKTEIADLKESKLDKTGGLISGNLDVAGSLFVNGENYDTTVSSLKEQVDLLSTLLFNTIITNTTVEDTYTTRVTAGGLPVVSNTPTTVHRIAGETKASENVADIYGQVGEGITKNGVTVTQAQDGYLHFSGVPTWTYRELIVFSQDIFSDGETYTFSQSEYFGASGVAHTVKNAVYWKVTRKNLATGEINYSFMATATAPGSVTFDKKTYSYGIAIVTGSYAYASGDEMNISLRFWANKGDTALPYSDYYPDLRSASFKGITSTGAEGETDTSFQLAAARSLHKWDYIDIDNQRVVTGTAEVTQETAFTDEELATYPAGYILSADRKTIAYPLETPTTAPLTVPKTYTAWRGGSETVDTGAADALPPTITQTYYEEVTA